MWRTRFVAALIVALLPGWLKRPIYRRLYGYYVGRDVSIGFGVVFYGVENCRLEDGARIGAFNVFWQTVQLEVCQHSRIGYLNVFRGGKLISIGPYVTILRCNVFNSILEPDAENLPDPVLHLGAGCVITTGHWLDFTDRIRLGPNSILGGRNSSLWTHSRQRTRPIEIGANCYLGSEVRVAPGVRIPALCVVALGSVLLRSIDAERCLIAGNPAAVLRLLSERDLQLATRKTRPDLPDELPIELSSACPLGQASFESLPVATP
jgi:acetyltransferase-like isoleucine patch superfamily enzyme